MNAVEIIREHARMCVTMSGLDCECCGLCSKKNGTDEACNVFVRENPEKAVEIIEKWAAENPIKTRQSEFLKMFPNAETENDAIRICPQFIEGRDNYECITNYGVPSCTKCRKEYWLTEVE